MYFWIHDSYTPIHIPIFQIYINITILIHLHSICSFRVPREITANRDYQLTIFVACCGCDIGTAFCGPKTLGKHEENHGTMGEKDGINGGYDGNNGEHGKNGEILHEHIHVVDFLRVFFWYQPRCVCKKKRGKKYHQPWDFGVTHGYPISRYIQLFGLCGHKQQGFYMVYIYIKIIYYIYIMNIK